MFKIAGEGEPGRSSHNFLFQNMKMYFNLKEFRVHSKLGIFFRLIPPNKQRRPGGKFQKQPPNQNNEALKKPVPSPSSNVF